MLSGPVRPTITYISQSSLYLSLPVTKGIYLSCTFHSLVDLNLGWSTTVSNYFTGWRTSEDPEKLYRQFDEQFNGKIEIK